MSRILLVGTATLDLVFELDHAPHADEEMRAHALRICRGGNAANTAVVLSGLGHQSEFLGALADAPETSIIQSDLEKHGVAFRNCHRLTGRAPTSSIYLSGANRSIVHYRDLPELPTETLTALDLNPYNWIHFEGRNIQQLSLMLDHVRRAYPAIPVSIELEKPRDGLETIFGCAELLLCSRGLAVHYGFNDPQAFLRWMWPRTRNATVVVAWGEAGAYALDASGDVVHAPAEPPPQIVDTLGAGDTFNAGIIHGVLSQMSLAKMISLACHIAGRKCGIKGFDISSLK